MARRSNPRATRLCLRAPSAAMPARDARQAADVVESTNGTLHKKARPALSRLSSCGSWDNSTASTHPTPRGEPRGWRSSGERAPAAGIQPARRIKDRVCHDAEPLEVQQKTRGVDVGERDCHGSWTDRQRALLLAAVSAPFMLSRGLRKTAYNKRTHSVWPGPQPPHAGVFRQPCLVQNCPLP
jgi:hypothetical protein